jgi:hypothetical protein
MPQLERQVDGGGMTMQQHAESQRRQAAELQQHAAVHAGPSIIQQDQAPTPPPGPHGVGILPTDLLPEEAKRDPAFIPGQGSMYAASQPQLAMKYGVLRNGSRLHPSQLRNETGVPQRTRADTLRDLQEATKAATQQQQRQAPEEDEEVPPPEKPEEPKRADKEVDEAIRQLDDFDYDEFRRIMNRDEINNTAQKKLIESRLKPLELDELIMNDRVSQRVPIHPPTENSRGFVPTFTSMVAEEDLAIKRLIMEESKQVVQDQYYLAKFGIMSAVVGLTAINGNPLPSHVDNDGKFSEDLFWRKFNWLIRRPVHMLASIVANQAWFEVRVRKLFVAEKVGNG